MGKKKKLAAAQAEIKQSGQDPIETPYSQAEIDKLKELCSTDNPRHSESRLALAKNIANWTREQKITSLTPQLTAKFSADKNKQYGFAKLLMLNKFSFRGINLFLRADLALKRKEMYCDSAVGVAFRLLAESGEHESFTHLCFTKYSHTIAAIGLRNLERNRVLSLSDLAKINPNAIIVDLWNPKTGQPLVFKISDYSDYLQHLDNFVAERTLEVNKDNRPNSCIVEFHTNNANEYHEKVNAYRELVSDLAKQSFQLFDQLGNSFIPTPEKRTQLLGFDLNLTVKTQAKIWSGFRPQALAQTPAQAQQQAPIQYPANVRGNKLTAFFVANQENIFPVAEMTIMANYFGKYFLGINSFLKLNVLGNLATALLEQMSEKIFPTQHEEKDRGLITKILFHQIIGLLANTTLAVAEKALEKILLSWGSNNSDAKEYAKLLIQLAPLFSVASSAYASWQKPTPIEQNIPRHRP